MAFGVNQASGDSSGIPNVEGILELLGKWIRGGRADRLEARLPERGGRWLICECDLVRE